MIYRKPRCHSAVAGHRPFHTIVCCSLALVLAAILPARILSAAPQPATSTPMQPLVLAHFMPCFPSYGVDLNDSYWWEGSEYNPYVSAHGRTARPIVAVPEGATDEKFAAVVADIRLAKQYGIDGFLVDELDDTPPYFAEWQRLLRAAEMAGGFKIGLEPDFATIPPKDAMHDKVKHWIDAAASSPAFLRYNGKPVVVSYGAGFPDGKSAPWEKEYLVDWMAAQKDPIAYAATHGVDWTKLYTGPDAHDPKTGYPAFEFATGSFSPMAEEPLYQRALDYFPSWLPQIGENSFVYYNAGWRYKTGGDLSEYYRKHWEWTIAHRDRVPWMMLITWNDWGETAIAPSNNHFMAWQPITRYYADWYKTGRAPAIQKDVVMIFHRQHPMNAPFVLAGTQAKGEVDNPPDDVEALALLTRPATLVIHSGEKTVRRDVPAGLQTLTTPFEPGVQSAEVQRNGRMIARAISPVPVTAKPLRQCLWYIGADSEHPPRPLPLNDWTVVTGAWKQSGTAHSGTGILAGGDPYTLANCSTQADVRPPTAGEAGLIGRRRGSQYYSFTITTGGAWKLALVDNQKTTVLDTGTTSAAASYKLRFDMVGEHLIGFINGQLVSSAIQDFKLPSGQIGFIATGGEAGFNHPQAATYDPDWKELTRSSVASTAHP